MTGLKGLLGSFTYIWYDRLARDYAWLLCSWKCHAMMWPTHEPTHDHSALLPPIKMLLLCLSQGHWHQVNVEPRE